MSIALPEVSRAALFEGPGRPFSQCELPLGRPEPGGALVQVSMAAVCGSDVLLRPAGRYVTAGLVLPSAAVELDASLVVRGMLTVRGVHNYQPRHLARALDFAARSRGVVPLADLVDTEMPLEAIDDAFAHAAARRGVRTAVVPSGSGESR